MKRIQELTQQLAQAQEAAQVQIASGSPEKTIEAVGRVLELARELGNYATEILALLELGRAYRAQGQTDEAHAAYADGLALCETHGESEIAVRFLFEDSRVYWDLGDQATTIATLDKASAEAQKLVNRIAELYVRLELASRLQEAGDHARALEESSWSVRLGRSTQQGMYALQALFIKVQALQDMERYDEALEATEEIKSNLHALNPESRVQFDLKLAQLYTATSSDADAVAHLDKARRIVEDARYSISSDLVDELLAQYRHHGHDSRADRLGELVRVRAQSLQKSQEEAGKLRVAAREMFEKGELEQAKDLYERSLQLSAQAEDVPGHIDSLKALGIVAEKAGALQAALQIFGQAAALCANANDLTRNAEVMYEFGRVRFLSGDLHDAMGTLREVEKIQRHIADDAGLGRTLLIIASIFGRLGMFPESLHTLAESDKLIGGEEIAIDLQIAYERGCALSHQKDPEQAIALFEQVCEQAQKHGFVDLQVASTAQIGEVLRAMERYDEALAAFDKALSFDKAHLEPRMISYIDHWKGLILLVKNDPASLEHLTRAWDSIRELGADVEVLTRFKEAAEVATARFDIDANLLD